MASVLALGADSASRPTYFELVAVERLMPALKRALIYSLSVFAQRRPALHKVLDWEDELFALLMLIVEHQSLSESDASVAESLYGLFRAPVAAAATVAAAAAASAAAGPSVSAASAGKPPPLGGLSRRQKWMSLLFLVGTPYLRDKADKAFTALSGGQAAQLGLLSADDEDEDGDPAAADSGARQRSGALAGPSGSLGEALRSRGPRGRAARALVAAYPLAMALADSWLFAHGVAYLVGRASVHSPGLRWAGLRVLRATPQDMTAAAERAQARRALAAASSGPLRTGAMRAWWALSDLSRPTLVGAVIGFKLLEWWYSTGEKRVGQGDVLPVPPPPAPLPPAADGVPLPRDPRLCPLCRRARTNPAVLACSGYVFCYPCIFDHVQRTSCCPVTRVPAGPDAVRRLFQM